MKHTDFLNYYETIFAFVQYHNWSMTELEAMMPWEFQSMVALLSNYIEKMELDRKQAMVGG